MTLRINIIIEVKTIIMTRTLIIQATRTQTLLTLITEIVINNLVAQINELWIMNLNRDCLRSADNFGLFAGLKRVSSCFLNPILMVRACISQSSWLVFCRNHVFERTCLHKPFCILEKCLLCKCESVQFHI